MSKPTPPRRFKRRWKALAVVTIGALTLFLALPWLLATGPGRSRVTRGLNQALSPGKLRFEGLQLSWFGPTRLSNVTLLDPKDVTVARVPSAVLDKTLGQLIFGGQQPSLLTLDGTTLEVERSPDGTVDLAQALQTLIANPDPKRDLTIQINHGTLRYRDPFLAEPLTADDVSLTLHIPAAPNSVAWLLNLGRGDASLEVRGDFDRWLSKGGAPRTPELQFGINSNRWPFVARTAGVDATGRLDGALDFARKRGKWVLTGDARLLGLNAHGKAFSGDSLVFDRLEAGWDLTEGESGWTVRRLSLTCPLGEIKAEGQLNGPNSTGKQRIEGKVDLAEIARQLPHALRLRDGLTVDRGSARVMVDLASSPGETSYDIEAKVSDLAARDHGRPLTLREPATLTGRLVRKGEESSVERFSVKTSYLDASAKGRLEEGVGLQATIDLAAFKKQLGEWFDLGMFDLAGRAEVSGSYRFRPIGSVKNKAEKLFDSPREGGPPVDNPITSPAFEGSLRATISDIRLDGVGPSPIRRDSATLEVSSNGPAETSGWPSGWNRADVLVDSGQSAGRFELVSRPGSIGVSAGANTPITVGSRTRKASARLSGEWSAEHRMLSLDNLLLILDQADDRPMETRIVVSSKGKLDLSSGELVLESADENSTKANPIVLDPDGLRISGIGKGLGLLRVDGGFSGNLESLDALLADLFGRSPLGLSGRWSAFANARGDADGLQLSGKLGLDQPIGVTPKPTRPTSMAVRAHYSPKLDRLDLSEFTVSTAYGTLDASGQLENPLGTRKIDLNGKVSPDFAAINALLVNKVEPGAKVEGKPRGFRASGTLGETSDGWKGLDGEFGFDIAGADIYGMKFGPSPVVLRSKAGKLSFDPISTTLNEGHIRLEPELDLDDPRGPTLRLAKNSTIRDARINDEVSKRVLAYVAPVLDQATRASGFVSVDLDHAEFPLGPGRGRQAKVEGAVVFEEVEFALGPLAAEILGAIGRRDLTLKLDQPVSLTIADGRINQRGMSIPIADFTRIDLAGWVDFDRNLSLVASVPVTPAMLGNNPLLSDIAAGTKVRLPITGTLNRPKIDREAFSANLQELGKSLLARGATRGAMELLMRLAKPKDPNAPPPPPRPTPEERKAQRQEKKAMRRGEIPPPPPENPRP